MNSFQLSPKQKQSFNLSLRLWLPLLQSPLQELGNVFQNYTYENPFLEYDGKTYESTPGSAKGQPEQGSGGKSAFIENTLFMEESLYDKLTEQIQAPIFPTPRSQKVALQIVEQITDEGFFEGELAPIAIKCGVTDDFVEKVRRRFSQLEPLGVGARDMKESFLFQLEDMAVDDELYTLVTKIIQNIKKIDKYHKHHRFSEATEIIKKFKTPPAIDYMAQEPQIIPDFFVDVGDDISIRINHSYYPDITVKDAQIAKNDQLRQKLKEARDLVNLLELRKSTLYKIILIIVQRQLRFFVGSELAPMTMQEVANELGFEESTISRAVSNKYIKCSRGVLPLKSFFTNAVSKDLSSSEVKNYVKQLVEAENKEIPLTDQDLADKVMERFDMKMVRRTITKYRKQLLIPSSKERKKIYRIG